MSRAHGAESLNVDEYVGPRPVEVAEHDVRPMVEGGVPLEPLVKIQPTLQPPMLTDDGAGLEHRLANGEKALDGGVMADLSEPDAVAARSSVVHLAGGHDVAGADARAVRAHEYVTRARRGRGEEEVNGEGDGEGARLWEGEEGRAGVVGVWGDRDFSVSIYTVQYLWL